MTIPHSRAHSTSMPASPPSDKAATSPITPSELAPDSPARTPSTSSAMTRSSQASETAVSGSGRSLASPVKKAPGKVQLEDFELIRVLGKGCAGRVLLVRHSHQNTIHAMKAISKRSVLASDEITHILTELDILKRLAIHQPISDFVTRLNYSFTDRENFYFVMDFYPGGDLATQLEMYGTLGHVRTRFYAADLVLGLEDLHRQGVILRDLKPENILLNASGHCVLADFGLSKEFPYRGDPQPLQVPQYEGEMVLPHWAGQGMGSVRLSPGGKARFTVDRAWSFVGTTEYLAPEVVKGQDYSYAVDWWALGCILFECLIGRVPFRTDDEESAQVLYNRICYEPWDWMLEDPRFRRRRETELDAVTEGFLDAKDPMRRLTEPYIQSHFYFSHIDWDLVRAGDYVDPHPLQLHPMAENNTRYFPKLCLEQDPNVDMSTHNPDEMEHDKQGRKLTALNDENTYKFEQLKYRKELEGFYWSREEGMDGVDEVEREEDGEGEVDSMGDEGMGTGSESYGSSSVESELPEQAEGDEASLISTEVDEAEAMEVDEKEEEEVTVKVKADDKEEIPPPPPPPAATTPKLAPVPLSGAMSSMQLGSPGGSPERLITPDTSDGDIPVHIREESDSAPIPSPVKVEVEAIPISEKQPPVISVEDVQATSLPDAPAKELPSPSPAPATSLPPPTILEPPAPTSPLSPVTRPLPPPKSIPIPLLRPSQPLPRLPSGLPASGLSVSDIVSIPSPGPDGPRLIRRHAQLASAVDSNSLPSARLSVDMHGTITQLGEDDWEALEGDENIPSAPNGYGAAPGSFLNRLRRRPSALLTSGLRRTHRGGSDSSRETSPTKGTPMFGTGATKKALGRLKAFPLLRSRQNSEQPPMPGVGIRGGVGVAGASNASLSTTGSPPSRKSSPRLLSRPEAMTRRHTESGWFERKLSRSGRYFRSGGEKEKEKGGEGPTRSSTMSSYSMEGSKDGWGAASDGLLGGDLGERRVGPPRVELGTMGSPVDWEFRLPVLPKKAEGSKKEK